MPIFQPTADMMSPLRLFLEADVVVKLVMVGLLAASVWTWAIIFTHGTRLARLSRKTAAYEQEFWAASDIDDFHQRRGSDKLPVAAVLSAGMDEWRRSTRTRSIDRAGTRERLASRMAAAAAAELDRLGDRLNILATVGSVAPFVGLFGTVWGIMRSFTAIAGANNTSLATVAPGIAEALFATAIGLFAAIPAVIAYNRLTHGLDRLEARLSRFADRFHDAEPRARSRRRARGRRLMAMGVQRGGRRRRRAPMAEINVTPMVDVMLVLLIIFMVTAPLLVSGVPIDLPQSRAAALDQNVKPVQVAIDKDGAITIDDRAIGDAALPSALAAIAAQPQPKQGRRVYLRADKALDYGRVMKVMGELNHAGLNRVALVSVGDQP